jgi:predicted acetyltransferase
MSHEVRVLTDDEEIASADTVFRSAMVGAPPVNLTPAERAALHEPGRTLGAIDDGELVGTAESFGSWLAVPGGARLPHAAVTHVGVLPTHTRRGILTALLRRQLEDIAARGEAVASLRATEAVIYERFGYGVASEGATYEIARRRAAPRDGVQAGAPVRLVDPGRSWKRLADIYEPAAWNGAIGRWESWWQAQARRASADTGPRYAAVTSDGDGFALYQPATSSEWLRSDRVVVVSDFVAHTDAAYTGLIRYLAALDLADTIRFQARPVDDPLPTLFTDRRAVTVTGVRDQTWLRLVDVPAALTARTYAAGEPVVIEVDDPLLPANSGRYLVGPDGAARIDKPSLDTAPDLSAGVSALAAAYLGGTRWATLGVSGQAREHRPGALAAADLLFTTPVAPFAGTGF